LRRGNACANPRTGREVLTRAPRALLCEQLTSLSDLLRLLDLYNGYLARFQ
jgi:hypothetical protein